jgi:hypothetical protein
MAETTMVERIMGRIISGTNSCRPRNGRSNSSAKPSPSSSCDEVASSANTRVLRTLTVKNMSPSSRR